MSSVLARSNSGLRSRWALPACAARDQGRGYNRPWRKGSSDPSVDQKRPPSWAA